MFDYNSQTSLIDEAISNRFKALYDVNQKTGCWIWCGSKTRDGYGQFKIGYKTYKPSRVSYLIHKGDIPEGLLVLHKCDIPPCVNPEHLFLGTPADNVADCIKKGRKALGSWHPSSKLKNNDIETLLSLLSLGYSFSYIAEKINISKSTIALICRGRSRADLKEKIAKAMAKPEVLIDNIEKRLHWGRSRNGWKLIKRTPYYQKKFEINAAKNKERICAVCNKQYNSPLYTAKYCSSRCAAKGFRNNNPSYYRNVRSKRKKKINKILGVK